MGHNPHNWLTGEVIAAQTLNDLEQGVAAAAFPSDIGIAGTATDTALRAAFAPRLSARSAPREAGLPTLMSNPPTLSGATVGWPSSTITSRIVVNALNGTALNTANFSFRGGPWQQYGTVNPDDQLAAPTFLHNEQPSFPYVEFLYYGTKFEFTYKGQGSLGSRVWVDGQLAEVGYTADNTQDGSGHTRIVTFSSTQWRRIRIDLYAPLYALYVGPNDVVVPAPRPGEKLLVIGDSFGEGTGANFYGGWPLTVAGMLGFAEVISLSQGGTGVLAVNSALSRPKYRDRAADWSGLGATSVLICMSVNDDAFSVSSVAAELDLLITAVKAISGIHDVWIMGRPAKSGADVATAQAKDAALKPTADARGVPYISLVSPDAIWTGTGHQGAITGSGSSDLLVGSDGVHPTQAGHDGIGRTFVNRLLNSLPV